MEHHQATNMDHEQAQKSYGSDRAQLVYGKRPDGTFAHMGPNLGDDDLIGVGVDY